MTGSTEKLNAFINLMEPLGLVDVSRTGVVAISRGAEPILSIASPLDRREPPCAFITIATPT